MTNRDFLNAVINGTVNADVIAFASAELEKMDARNAKRAATPSKTAIANEPIKANIKALFVDGSVVVTAPEVGKSLNITTQKASALLRQLEGEGYVVSKKGKSKHPRAYHLA